MEKYSSKPVLIDATTMQRPLDAHVPAQLEVIADLRISLGRRPKLRIDSGLDNTFVRHSINVYKTIAFAAHKVAKRKNGKT